MAIRYVSNTADNGYQVGANSGTALTKAAPWLTLDYALTNASPGDQIYVNGGATPAFILSGGGANVYTAATFFNISQQLDVIGDNYPTLKRTGAVTRVLNVNIQATVTIQDLILDGENTASLSNFTISTQVGRFTVNVLGVKMINSLIYSINSSALLCDLNVQRCNLSSVRGGIKTVAVTAGSLTAIANVVNSSGIQANEAGIMFDAGAILVTHYISDNIVNIVAASNNSRAIRVNNSTGIIQRNRWSTAGAFVTCAGILVGTNAAILAEDNLVRWNFGVHGCFNGASAGWGYLVGSDGDGADTANDNMMNRTVMYGNALVGSYGGSTPLLHGVEFGHVIGGCAAMNLVANAGIGILAKRTTGDLYFVGNTLASPTFASTSGAIRLKGAQNVRGHGNCVVMQSAGGNWMVLNNQEPTVPAQVSANNVLVGNTFSAQWLATKMVSSETGSTAKFLYNDYDAPQGLSGVSPFQYGGVNYASFSLWAAAQEATLQQIPAGAADKEFWDKVGLRPGAAGAGRWLLPPSGSMPAWGA